MKNTKKLTRTQRTILDKLGYDNLEDVRYLEERGKEVIFVRGNGKEIAVDKATYYKMK